MKRGRAATLPTINADPEVIADFGREWSQFDQRALTAEERQRQFDAYFRVFPWEALPSGAVGFDAGCGSGRWAQLVAPRVGHLHCIDPSEAIDIVRRNLADVGNCSFHRATVDAMPIPDGSMDFGYSLGVLHHIPDTGRGLAACVCKLKPGAPFLVYLYYALENRPAWFRAVWRVSDGVRRIVSRVPHSAKYAISQVIAVLVYLPLARAAAVLERSGANVSSMPLSAYRDRSFYSMRTDALDRFGTKLERRFTRQEIQTMMEQAGLRDIRFSPGVPFWCAVGTKR